MTPESRVAAPAKVEAKPVLQPDRVRTEAILKAFHEEERFGKAYDARLLRRLWPFLKPHRLLIWAALVVILITSAGALIRPLVMKRAIDQGVLSGDLGELVSGALVLGGILLGEQLL